MLRTRILIKTQRSHSRHQQPFATKLVCKKLSNSKECQTGVQWTYFVHRRSCIPQNAEYQNSHKDSKESLTTLTNIRNKTSLQKIIITKNVKLILSTVGHVFPKMHNKWHVQSFKTSACLSLSLWNVFNFLAQFSASKLMPNPCFYSNIFEYIYPIFLECSNVHNKEI